MYENLTQVLDRFAEIPAVHWAAVALSIALGTALLFYGWKLYRIGLVMAGAGLGAVGCLWLAEWTAESFQWRIPHEAAAIFGLATGALAAWPMEKLAVLLVTGSAGAVLFVVAGLQTWSTNPQLAGVLFAVSVPAFLIFAWLSQGLRQVMVVVSTSLLGATVLIWFPMAVLFGRPALLPESAEEARDAARTARRALRQLPRVVRLSAMGTWLVMAGFGIMIQLRRELDPEAEQREQQRRRDREEWEQQRKRDREQWEREQRLNQERRNDAAGK